MSVFLPFPLSFLLTAAAVFLASVSITQLMIRINITALPLQRSSHQVPTPSAGGTAFILSFALSLLWLFWSNDPIFTATFRHYLIGYSMGAIVLAVTSFIDDYHPLSYTIRLFVHFLSVLLLISYTNLGIESTVLGIEFGSPLSKFLAIFALMALINGANFCDGLNGLLSGSVLLNLIFSYLLMTSSAINSLCILLFAALVGFFIFNFPKAKIFMGDVGSTFLGYTLGFMALIGQRYYNLPTDTALINKGFVFILLPLSFLWFDVAFTILRRIFLKRPLTQAHRDHMFHTLNDLGYSHQFISSLYFLGTFITGTLTLACHYGYISFLSLIAVYSCLQLIFCLWVFHKKRPTNNYTKCHEMAR